MEEAILHIGTDKTGTTSLQQSFAGYDDGTSMYTELPKNNSVPFDTIFSDDFTSLYKWKRRGVRASEIEKSELSI